MPTETEKAEKLPSVNDLHDSKGVSHDVEHGYAREVHHRVKNNLQIISSLLSIHARDASNADVMRAYTAMQMRVNALSCVHRWLFDEQQGQGVNSAKLISDLVPSLERSIANVDDINLSIEANIGEIIVAQDVAVPLAFLITEIVGCAGTAAATAHETALHLAITLRADNAKSDRHLTIAADIFKPADLFSPENQSASARIIRAMVRQLRGTLVHMAAGSYEIVFPAQLHQHTLSAI